MRRSRALIASVLVTILTAGACSQATPSTPSGPVPSGPVEVVAGLTTEPGTLDPHQRNPPVEGLLAFQIFDTLVKEAPDAKLGPGLAESWQFAADGLSVTLKLRAGVKFHDGTPFDAAAVKFNYERQMDENNEYYKDGTWRLVGLFAGNFKLPVEVIDNITVKLNFKEKLAPDIMLNAMANTPHAMVSPTAVKATRKEFPNKPVGTGPFRFVSWEKGQRIVLEKNPDYWGPKPQIDRLILVPIRDADARLQALKTGTIDINTDIAADQVEALRSDSKFTTSSNTARHIWHVLLNQKTVPQLVDKRVRLALNYAVNKEAIVKDILRGTGTVAKGPMSPAFGDYYHDALAGIPYD